MADVKVTKEGHYEVTTGEPEGLPDTDFSPYIQDGAIDVRAVLARTRTLGEAILKLELVRMSLVAQERESQKRLKREGYNMGHLRAAAYIVHRARTGKEVVHRSEVQNPLVRQYLVAWADELDELEAKRLNNNGSKNEAASGDGGVASNGEEA